tara:strand:+ start:339 stop:1061 length:723 start_codon:yes stop_codon:yes gene_type:complete
MSNKLKIFLGFTYLLILTIFLYFLFSKIEINRLGDFVYYKELQLNISKFIGDNLYLNLISFFLFSLIWIVLLGFGSPLLIISGIFFGQWLGFFISLISISIGTLILYIVANFFFKDLVKSYLEIKFSKYISIFKKNEFYYFFAFRFLGGLGIPFGLQNILPVIFDMKKINYFFGSFFGFIPHFFIWNTIGSGINNYIEQSDRFSFLKFILNKEIFIPLISIVILILISFYLKNKIFNEKN